MFAHPNLEADFKARSESLQLSRVVPAMIDSTILKPDFRLDDLRSLAVEAIDIGFRAVCIPPAAVPVVSPYLRESTVQCCTVVGFPLGFQTTSVKCFEAAEAIKQGASEIDFVQNLQFAKSHQVDKWLAEMRQIVEVCGNTLVKVILETSLLTPEEIIKSVQIAYEAGVHVIKTSTGFGARGASIQDISLIASTLANLESKSQRRLGIKASGGIRDAKFAMSLIDAGATRIGTSCGSAILH
jgi:deoxyribose-phosphate aldolase